MQMSKKSCMVNYSNYPPLSVFQIQSCSFKYLCRIHIRCDSQIVKAVSVQPGVPPDDMCTFPNSAAPIMADL